jgi:hypothetical protein
MEELAGMLREDGVTAEEFEEMLEKQSLFLDAMRTVMISRRLFVTETGYVGAAPVSARVGDIVCIFEGGAVPYVIRADKVEGWRFIGECYVQGIMDGEVLAREGFVWEKMRLT